MNDGTSFSKFDFPTSWRHGRGLAGRIGEFVKQLGCRHPLVLTDRLLVTLKVIDPVFDSLAREKIDYEVCDAVTYEPTLDLFDTLIKQTDIQRFDAIIAVGGGSVIDVSKGLALVGSFGGHIKDYTGLEKVPAVPGIKTITVPTTAGTGSEISDGVVLIDQAQDTKFLVLSKKICPTMALTDPQMTLSMPPAVTATSGIDALVHAIESYISKGASAVTETFSLKAIELLGHGLKHAYQDGRDIDRREQMQIGATMAMTAGMNAYLGLCHAMAMPLCALYHMPHGQAVGMALAPVLAYNSDVVAAKVMHVLDVMGMISGDEKAQTVIQPALQRLNAYLTDIGIAARLADFGYRESHLATIIKETMDSAQRPTNPRNPSTEGITAIIREMI